jgi:hypothetical protein
MGYGQLSRGRIFVAQVPLLGDQPQEAGILILH